MSFMGQRGLNIFTSEVSRGQQVNQNYEPTSMKVPLILSIRRTIPHFLMGKQAIEQGSWLKNPGSLCFRIERSRVNTKDCQVN